MNLTPSGLPAASPASFLLLLAFGLFHFGCTEAPPKTSDSPVLAESTQADPGSPSGHLAQVPADLDVSTERTSRDGRFLGRLKSSQQPPPLDSLHTWTLELEDSRGRPVSGARLRVDGGMPQHSHGLPTQPLVKPGDEEGTYLVEGIRFHMRGWWQLIFTVEEAVSEPSSPSDVLTFDLVLE